jgi:anthranilate phosphoribosyltransferase
MAEALAEMAIERAFVVHGAAGWDEATPIGPFVCHDVRAGRCTRTIRDPAQLRIAACTASALEGADAASNARRLRAALSGEDTVAHRDALAIGAGLALEVTGTSPSLAAGVERARAAIADGSAAKLLARLDTFAASVAR